MKIPAGRFWTGLAPLLAAMLALWSPPAMADGDARLATTQEKAFHDKAFQACQKAAPATPAGWEMVEASQPYQLDRVSTGLGKSPWPVNYRLAWQDGKRLRASEDKAMQAGVAMINQQKADQPTLQLQKELETLSKELGQAFKKGDQAQAQAIQERMEPLSKKLQAIYDERDRQFQSVLNENQPQDARASMTVQINSLYEELSGAVSQEPAINGHQVWRSQGVNDPRGGWREGVTLVLMGKWTAQPSGDKTLFKAQTSPDLPATATQSVAVRMSAEPARARSLLTSLGWPRLEELLGK